jgi:hypothetical protein
MTTAMQTVLFSTQEGSPIAFLLLSQPTPPGRRCVFVTGARDAETFNSREAQILLSDRPTEYDCSITTGPDGTHLEFKNQNGWHFVVRLDRDRKGQWSGRKASEVLSGLALGLGS